MCQCVWVNHFWLCTSCSSALTARDHFGCWSCHGDQKRWSGWLLCNDDHTAGNMPCQHTVTKGLCLFVLSNTNERRSELTHFPHFKQSLGRVCLSVFNYKLNPFNSPYFFFLTVTNWTGLKKIPPHVSTQQWIALFHKGRARTTAHLCLLTCSVYQSSF